MHLWNIWNSISGVAKGSPQPRSPNVTWDDHFLFRTAVAAPAKPCRPPPATWLFMSGQVMSQTGSVLWVSGSAYPLCSCHFWQLHGTELPDSLIVCSEVPAQAPRHLSGWAVAFRLLPDTFLGSQSSASTSLPSPSLAALRLNGGGCHFPKLFLVPDINQISTR